MQASQTALNLIKKYEGFSAKIYLCPAGKATIGYGHVVKKSENFLKTISKKQAEKLLADDALQVCEQISKLLKITLSQNQFDAVVCFVYNVGIGNFTNSTMLKLLNSGDIKAAAGEFERWIYSNGKILSGLKTRRQEEKQLFLR